MVITRFVILHHRERSGEHWDLMIEQSRGLATWRLARMPAPDDPIPIAATRLADHRKAYLVYEGRLSGDRGEVSRVESGACEILEQTESRWCFRLGGARLIGDFRLTFQSATTAAETAGPGASWVFTTVWGS